MSAQEVEQCCPDEVHRRMAFRLLVTGQDLEMTVAESRQMVMDICRLTEEQVIDVEREGMECHWPPL